MKNKRFIMYGAILIIVFILIFIGYCIYKNIKKENKNSEFEYVPQEEISEEQLRQTVITLYFLDSNEYKLAPEARTIDSKQLELLQKLGFIVEINDEVYTQKTIELDQLDILYRHGILGFTVYFAQFLAIIILPFGTFFCANSLAKTCVDSKFS